MLGKSKELTDKRESAPPKAGGSLPVFLLYCAIGYNAFLAFVNAHVSPIDATPVMAAEMLIVFIACIYISKRLGVLKKHISFMTTAMIVFFGIFILVSVSNGVFYIKSVRDVLVIFIFTLMGTQCAPAQLIRGFRYITLVVLAVMLLEGFYVGFYAWLFRPAIYYANTRGVELYSMDTSGLFRNSLGVAGRFSFGLFGQRRLSSIFLEQVSLANYAMILAMVTMVFWKSLKSFDRSLFVFSIIFIVMANSTRTGIGMCLLMIPGYALFPRLPARSFRYTMPLLLILFAILFYDPNEPVNLTSDDLRGRMAHTFALIGHMNLRDLLMGNISGVPDTGDSGYAYLIYTQTLFGLAYFWYALTKIMPFQNDVSKRYSLAVAIFIAFNLMIGGAVLSIKVAGPLWLIAGCLSVQPQQEKKRRATYV